MSGDFTRSYILARSSVRGFPRHQDVGKDKRATRPEDAAALRQHRHLVGCMKERILAPDHVEGLIGVSQLMKVPVLEVQQVFEVGLLAAGAGQLQLLFADVGAGDPAAEACGKVAAAEP